MLPALLFICGSFCYLQMLSKNTGEKFVLLGAYSLKAEVERSTLFLFMQFYGEERKKKSSIYAAQKQIMANNTKITDIK